MSKTSRSIMENYAANSASSVDELRMESHEAAIKDDNEAVASVDASKEFAEREVGQKSSAGGRPTSFEPGEVRTKRTYRMSEEDVEAINLYLSTIAEEIDASEVVRKAVRAYIPAETYDMARNMLEMKRVARTKKR